VSRAELGWLAADMLTTAGDVNCLRHYLPRILEIAVTEGFNWPDLEIVVGKLACGDEPWTTWTAEEQEAIENFFAALWKDHLSTPPDEAPLSMTAEDVLCAISQSGQELEPYLRTWSRLSPTGLLHLKAFIDDCSESVRRERLPNAFWNQDRAQEIIVWLKSNDLLTDLADRAAQSPHHQETANYCFDALANL
jgi:hypothetical protein